MSEKEYLPTKADTLDSAENVIQETETSEVADKATPEEIAFAVQMLGHDGDGSTFDLKDRDFLIYLNGTISLDYDEARSIVEETLRDHRQDRNFPVKLRSDMEYAVSLQLDDMVQDGISGAYLTKACAAFMKFTSPYPDVRACTRSYDDWEEPHETFRAYVVGVIWVGIASFVNQFFEVRQPPIQLTSGLLQLFVIPSGYLVSKILPDWGFTVRGVRHSLNPGPWSYKEQTFVTVMFGITSAIAYVDSQILVQKLPMFYNNDWAGKGYQICMLLSTQYLGFGIAGIFRNILVYPTQNLWMNQFPALALNKSFFLPDNREAVNGWRLTKWQFFAICFAAIFLYEWIPLYLMQFLGNFNWMTWIKPDNFNLAAITGGGDGLGFNPISTFDWSTINFITPLQTPFFSMCNIIVGAVTGGLIIIAVYYSNMYNSAYLPINSNEVFDNTGAPYEVSQILTDNVLDGDKYQQYSPPYYTAANLVTYGSFFAAYTCLYVTALLYDWQVMWESCKELVKGVLGRGKSIHDYKDAHSRMMQRYKETPQWWFIVVLLCALALALATLKGFPTGTPVWGLFMALGLSIVFLVPISVLFAQTNNQMSINVLVELIIGYAKPGHGTAMMLVKAYGVNTNSQALLFMNDLKLAHYAKLPPRSTFRAQMVATLVSALVVFGVCQFQLEHVDGICTPAQAKTTKFTCPSETTYFSASVIWGVIGPKRIFNSEYPMLKWCFLIGCFIPIPLYLVRRFVPRVRKLLLHIEPNSMIMGILNGYAPYNLMYILPGFYVNALFMYFVRHRYTKWFEKYHYVMTAALTAGTALSAFIIFFSTQYHPKNLDWWGNSVSTAGLDGSGAALLTIPSQGYFGDAPGHYYY